MTDAQSAITKTASLRHAFLRPYQLHARARSAFSAFLRAIDFQEHDAVLLPAYVGWSAREGSGVFDPVRELGLAHAFYRIDERLHIDLDHLQEQLKEVPVKVLVLIHYFGHVDPGYADAVALARSRGVWVLEDEAHAMYTDLVGGISGRCGDACIFSLHKMLPVQGGGMLLLAARHGDLLDRIEADAPGVTLPWAFDMFGIAERRRLNAERLAELLPALAGDVEPLWGPPLPGEVPQTFPVLVRRGARDELYTRLNAAGFGVVSLYHTLISEIPQEAFPISHQLSRSILNLPVHQDVTPEGLVALVEQLRILVRPS